LPHPNATESRIPMNSPGHGGFERTNDCRQRSRHRRCERFSCAALVDQWRERHVQLRITSRGATCRVGIVRLSSVGARHCRARPMDHDDAVKMIGHDDIRIKSDVGKVGRDLLPAGSNNPPNWPEHTSPRKSPKQTSALVSTQGDKIRPGRRIVVVPQPDGTPAGETGR